MRRFSTTTVHRDWLREFTLAVRDELLSRDSLSVDKLPGIYLERAPYTDGWSAEIVSTDIAGIDSVGAFVDTTPRSTTPKVWAGLFISGRARAESIARLVERHVGPIKRFEEREYVRDSEHTYFATKLAKRYFDRPIVELFDRVLKDIGIYWSDDVRWSRPPASSLVRKTADFLAEAITAVEGIRLTKSMHAKSWAYSNREIRVTTKVFRRSSAQAKSALARDGWTCQVCGLLPEARYGIAGRSCLEAHHVVALHASKGPRVTRLEDLITVCANCHRALGQMRPDQRGLTALRRRLKNHDRTV